MCNSATGLTDAVYLFLKCNISHFAWPTLASVQNNYNTKNFL